MAVASLEQAAVVEEHVHELPQHVVERLDELLADRRVLRGRHEGPLRRRVGCERERQGTALARRRKRLLLVEGDHDVVRGDDERGLRGERAPLAREPDRGQRPLADDHRVHELDGHVARVRARAGRRAQRDEAAAAREALGHAMAQPREPLGLGLEERPVGPGALGQSGVGRDRLRHTAAPSGDATPASQSRQASIPSPVRALTSSLRAPGFTTSRL